MSPVVDIWNCSSSKQEKHEYKVLQDRIVVAKDELSMMGNIHYHCCQNSELRTGWANFWLKKG